VSYPPGPGNPYEQQPQPGQQPYGYPQQPGYPGAQQPGYPGAQQPGYGYPAAPAYDPNAAYGYGGYDPNAGQPQLSGWWRRVGANIIDGLIAGVPALIFIIIAAAAKAPVVAVLGYLIAFGVGLWLIYLKGTKGQSLGYRATGIRLARLSDGQNVGFGLAFGRQLLHLLDGWSCYLGYLWPLWDEKHQTFADKIVSTVVVRVN
jgi:uncharacterized RDD family membrane protein YckC